VAEIKVKASSQGLLHQLHLSTACTSTLQAGGGGRAAADKRKKDIK